MINLWQSDNIRPLHQLTAQDQALVLSNPFNDNAARPRVFYAALCRQDGRWLVEHRGHVTSSNVAAEAIGVTRTTGSQLRSGDRLHFL
jgi:hypothetical protein